LVLAARGFHTVLAGVRLPNEASVGLHRAIGFEPVGTYRRIGWNMTRGMTSCGFSGRSGQIRTRPAEPL
jgi:L-amino acid N-acyltransferase YncA